VAFGVEELEGVDAAELEAEGGGGLVEVDGAAGGGVQAAEVHGQLAVDEDPEVVVAGEGEVLAAAVLDAGVQLGGEVEVVRLAVGVVAGVAETGVVEGEKVGALEGGDAVDGLEREVDDVGLVDVGDGPVPLIEVHLAGG